MGYVKTQRLATGADPWGGRGGLGGHPLSEKPTIKFKYVQKWKYMHESQKI